MNDPLANFRRRTADSSPSSTAPDGGGYVAFAAKDRVERLKIKRANKPTHAPGYGYLLDIIYDGNHGTNFVLVYTVLGVKVTGSFPAITVTVTSPSITAGSTVYFVTASGLQAVSGDSVKAGSATFTITSDPTVEVAATAVAATSGTSTAIAGATSSQTGKPFILEGGIAALLCAVGAVLLVAVRRRGRPA